MVNKRKPPPSKQLISSNARRRRRLLRLKRLESTRSEQPEPPQQQEKKPEVNVLYFPSTLCDNFQSPSVPVSPDSDDSLHDTKEAYFSTESEILSSNIPSTITLFSLSPGPSSPSRPSHSDDLDNTYSSAACSHQTSPDNRHPRRSFSLRNNRLRSQQCDSNDCVKDENSTNLNYAISNIITGRRVVDLGLILEKFEVIAQHPLQCPRGRMVALSEDINYLRSTIRFICHECGQESTLESDLHLLF